MKGNAKLGDKSGLDFFWQRREDDTHGRQQETPEEIAEERIEEARKSKATHLNLAGLGLTELPSSIGQLAQLQSLDVSRNELTALPESLAQLTQLRNLCVSHNRLTTLPEAISYLSQLQELDASENKLRVLPESLLEVIRLQDLAEYNKQLTQRQSFDFNRNQLPALPTSQGELRSFKALYLHGNSGLGLPPRYYISAHK
jgi:Leucine-rich repeat (LRR) protein